jgi:hypothetical protein
LDTHIKIISNKSEYGDLNRISNGEGKFKFATKEGVGIRGVVEGVQECFCLDIQKFEGHSTKVGLALN